MKTTFIIIAFILVTHTSGYAQRNLSMVEILLGERIGLSYCKHNLIIDVKDNKLLKFQLWKNSEMILSASGSAKGKESFPLVKGKYRIVIFLDNDKKKTFKFVI